MTDSRQLCLSSHGRIDASDAQVRKYSLNYVSWKYWHSFKLHCDALALVMAYDMHIECATEEDPRECFGMCNEDKLDIINFHDFRTRVALTGLNHDATNCKYPGDNKMREPNEI